MCLQIFTKLESDKRIPGETFNHISWERLEVYHQDVLQKTFAF